MMFNVQSAWNRVIQLSRSPNERNLSELRSLSSKIKAFTDEYVAKFSDRIHPNKLSLLQAVTTRLMVLQNERDASKVAVLCDNIDDIYGSYNAIPATYLLRHPEKFSSKQITPEETGKRALTTYGVKQAKEFADFIVYEMMVTTASVRLVIDFSYYKRTKLFGQVIETKAKWAADEYCKKITVSTSISDLLSGDLMVIPQPPPKSIEDYFHTWLTSDPAKQVAGITQAWFNAKKPIGNTYTIYVGVTHLPNLAAFLLHNLKLDTTVAEKVQYAAFIKKEDENYYYDRQWRQTK